ncbi:MAG: hypothetical protein JWO61_209 [Candidatus Saccharibacteria bacterium]|nr:hypothetical protein [Candidatus Saccharibacteria bacterium]
MAEQYTTQRLEYKKLYRAAGMLSREVPPRVIVGVQQALAQVPSLWNPATSTESLSAVADTDIRRHICELARKHLAVLVLEGKMPTEIRSSVDANLRYLGNIIIPMDEPAESET